MTLGLGRMPARMKFAFIFAVTLLLPGVTSMSIYRSEETTDSVTSAPEETTLDKYEAETDETERDYSEVGLTPLDDAPEFYETVSPVNEEATMSLLSIGNEETDEEEGETNLEVFPEESDGLEANTEEDENPEELDELDEVEDDALDLIRPIVKRDAEEDDFDVDEEADEADEEALDLIRSIVKRDAEEDDFDVDEEVDEADEEALNLIRPIVKRDAEEDDFYVDEEADEADEEALDLIRSIVKRDAEDDFDADEEVDEADEESDAPTTETIDEDEFSFSDLPRVFEPLIQAFSNSESGPPSPDDFFSWLPALKDLLEPNEEPSTNEPTDLPSDSVTDPARSSSFSTFPEPSLQIAPASPAEEPTESEIFPSSSLLEELTTSVPPTVPMPPQPSQPSPSDVPEVE